MLFRSHFEDVLQGRDFGNEPAVFVTVVVADENARDEGLRLLYELRKSGVPSEMDYSGKGVKAQMKAAGASRSAFVCLLGSNEVEKGVVAVKEMETGTQAEIERDKVVSGLAAKACSRLA